VTTDAEILSCSLFSLCLNPALALFRYCQLRVINDGIDQWHRRLHACIRARGEH